MAPVNCWRNVAARCRFHVDKASASARLWEPGRTNNLGCDVSTTVSDSGLPASKGCRSAGSTPRPLVALHCGSTSITRALLPDFARPAAMLIADVVFPTPPFWLATLMILAIPGALRAFHPRAVATSSPGLLPPAACLPLLDSPNDEDRKGSRGGCKVQSSRSGVATDEWRVTSDE